MNGDKWVQPWRLDLPISTWAGITNVSHSLDLGRTIDAFPELTWVQLCLDHQQIPAKIGNWKKVKLLGLSGDLYGTLPVELFGMPELFYLILRNTPQLTGTVPKTWVKGKQVDVSDSGIKIQ